MNARKIGAWILVGILLVVSIFAYFRYGDNGVSSEDSLICEESGGEWKEFSNACVDSCIYRRNETDVCAQVLTMGCDCGEGMCWNGGDCVDI